MFEFETSSIVKSFKLVISISANGMFRMNYSLALLYLSEFTV